MPKDNREQTGETAFEFDFKDRKNCGGHVGALVIIFLGIVFLLNNLDILPWGIWDQLWKFWPVILILIGIQMFFRKSSFSGTIITVITLFVLAGILAFILFSNGLLFLPPGK